MGLITRIKIEGNGTVENAKKISTSFKEALTSVSSITLDLQALQKIDVSFLQLLVSLDKECSRQKISLCVDSKGIPERIIKAVSQLGLSHCSEIRMLFHLT